MPYREDCWSVGGTSTLIDTWGERFIELSRGNLRQKQWQEVADAVNTRRGGTLMYSARTGLIPSRKSKKVEQARVSDGAIASQWSFYSYLGVLVGASAPTKKAPSTRLLPPSCPLISRGLPLAAAATTALLVLPVDVPLRKKHLAATSFPVGNSFFRRHYLVDIAAAVEGNSGSFGEV